MKLLGYAATVAALMVLPSCTHKVEVEPLRIEPIHLTVDLNIRVDRELDEFFAYEEEAPEEGTEADPEMEGST
jgi:hypothetical protein